MSATDPGADCLWNPHEPRDEPLEPLPTLKETIAWLRKQCTDKLDRVAAAQKLCFLRGGRPTSIMSSEEVQYLRSQVSKYDSILNDLEER